METREIIISGSEWIEKITQVLKGNNDFSYRFTTDGGKRTQEINVSTIWDQEAYEFARDFSILAKVWPHLNIPAVLQARQKSITNQLDRIRHKKLYGRSTIDGYAVSSCIINPFERKTITVVFAQDGTVDLERSFVRIDQNNIHQEIPLGSNVELVNFVLSHLYNQLTTLADENSNTKAVTTIETVLETLLALVETRLQLVAGSTQSHTQWD